MSHVIAPKMRYRFLRLLIDSLDRFPKLELSNPQFNMKSRIISRHQLHSDVEKALNLREPLLVTRYGTAEGELIRAILTRGLERDFEKLPHLASQLWTHAGIFPPQKDIFERVSEYLMEAYANADIVGVRLREPYYWRLESFLNRAASPCSKLVDIEDLFPLEALDFWQSPLRGKKVLVVHPFKKSIERQIRFFRENTSPNSFWNDTNFRVLRGVQSISANQSDFQFKDWVMAIEFMKGEIMIVTSILP